MFYSYVELAYMGFPVAFAGIRTRRLIIPNECIPFDLFVVALSAEALDIFLAVALLRVTLLFENLDGLVEGFYCSALHLNLLRSKAKENQCAQS